MNQLVDVKEASTILGVKESWLRNAVKLKKIPHVKLGRLLRFRRTDLESLVNNVRK